MTSQISYEKAAVIIKLYLSGIDQAKIAKKVGVSQSTVVACIDRFRHEFEAMPEYTMKKYHIEDVIGNYRALSVEMRAAKMTAEEARKGVKIRKQMKDAGADDSDILRLIGAMNKEGFIEAALKLLELERRGKSYDDVIEEYNEKANETKRLGSASNKLGKEVEVKEARLSDLKHQCGEKGKELHSLLSKHRTTSEKLGLILSLVNKDLGKKGLSKEEINELLKLVSSAGGLCAYLNWAKREKNMLEGKIAGLRTDENGLLQRIETLDKRKTAYCQETVTANSTLEEKKKEILLVEQKLKNLRSAHERKSRTIILVRTILSFLQSKDVYAFKVDDLTKILLAAQQSKDFGNDTSYKDSIERAKKGLAKIIFPMVKDEFVEKWRFELKEAELCKVRKDLANDYVSKVEYEKIKHDFELVKPRQQETEEFINKMNKINEAQKKQFNEQMARKNEEVRTANDEMSKAVSERNNAILERDRANAKMCGMMPIAVWYLANMKPGELTYEELCELEKLIKDVKQKKALPAAISKLLEIMAWAAKKRKK